MSSAKVSARWADQSTKPLPDDVQAWVDGFNAGLLEWNRLPVFEPTDPKIVLTFDGGESGPSQQHWAPLADPIDPQVTMAFRRFIDARLLEDEEAALAASPGPWRLNAEADEVLAVDDITVAEAFALSNRQLRATATHIARHNPSRVLVEVEAKRAIVKRHYRRRAPDWDRPDQAGFECAQCGDEYPCPTLRLIAAPFADWPGYKAEWAPGS
jgi:hypothetical protein